MRKTIVFVVLLLTFLFNLNYTKVYALEEELLEINFLGSDTINTGFFSHESSYILRLGDELYYDRAEFHNKDDVIIKITTLFNKFYYRDLSIPGSDFGILIDEFKYIILDFTKIYDEEIITIDTGYEEIVISSTILHEFRFINSSEFEIAPNDLIYISDYDNPLDINDINKYYLAWDEYDKNITSEIEVLDNYTENNKVVGDHQVKLLVKDNSLNESMVTYIIRVSDLTAPVFEDLEVISISYLDTHFDYNHQLENILITDNVTSREDLNITIIENTYEGNEDKLGNYIITYKALDEAGNEAIITQEINVIDTTPPVVLGELEYTTNYQNWLRPSDLVLSLDIYDEIDGSDVTIKRITDEYSPNYDKLGTYKIYYSVKDKSGNETLFNFIINVVDDVPPKFYINLNQLTIDNVTFINEAELLEFFLNQVNFIYDDIKIITNDYLGNEDKVGVYQVILKTTYNNKETYLKGIIRVDEYLEIPIENRETPIYKDRNIIIIFSISSVFVVGFIIYYIKKKKSQF